MAKSTIEDWDATASNNTDIGGLKIAQGTAVPSDMDNALREFMAQIRAAKLIGGGLEQTRTDAEKLQALANLSAIGTMEQTLTDAEKLQARTNLDISRTNLGISGKQVLSHGAASLAARGATTATTDVPAADTTSIVAPFAGCTLRVQFSATLEANLGTNTGGDIGGACRLHYYDGANYQPFGNLSYSVVAGSAGSAITIIRDNINLGWEMTEFFQDIPNRWFVQPHMYANYAGNTVQLINPYITWMVLGPYQ